MSGKPLFRPWKPRGENPRLEGVRLLVLGESHYEEPEDGVVDGAPELAGLTRWVVQTWGLSPPRRLGFFANLFAVLMGESWSLDGDHGRLWNSVFYYNYVQSLVHGGPRHAPTDAQFQASEAAFRIMLEDIRPEAVLVLGQRLWNNMATEDGWASDPPAALSRVCAYRLADGSAVYAVAINHPSSFGFSTGRWRERVLIFLDWIRPLSTTSRSPDADVIWT